MAATSKEKPLHLFVSADDEQKIEKARNKVRSLIDSAKPITMTGSGLLIGKVMVNIENDPSFGLLGKILGPKGQFIKHIAAETNTKVQLRGKGSGYAEGSTRSTLFSLIRNYIIFITDLLIALLRFTQQLNLRSRCTYSSQL